MATWIDDYVAWSTKLTDAPVVYHRWCAYSALSAVLGRKLAIQTGANPLYPNLYILLLGQSSIMRKSTALSLSRRILKGLSDESGRNGLVNIMADEGSCEGMFTYWTQHPTSIMYQSEMSSLLNMFRREYSAGLLPTLTDLYDCPDEKTKVLSGQTMTIVRPCISILAASTPDWVVDTGRGSDFTGGFLARFCIVNASRKERTEALPPPLDKAGLDSLRRRLATLIGFTASVKQHEEHPVSVDPIRSEYERWYKSFERQADHSRLMASFVSRLAMTCLKLTLLESVAERGSPILNIHAFERAAGAVQTVVDAMRELERTEIGYGDDRDGKDMKAVAGALHRAGAEGIGHSVLMANLKLPSQRMAKAIKALIDSGTAEAHVVKTQRRPLTIYRATQTAAVSGGQEADF